MKVALNGGRPKFSFIESEVNDQGFIKFTAVKKEATFYAAAENNVGNEFKEVTMSKKYQVDKFKFGVNEDFTSPIDGTVYPYVEGKTHPYMQYLSDSAQFAGEARTEGVGHNSILAVDTVPNANGSVFHDVNMKFGPVGVKNATAEKAADVAANSVVTTALPKTSSTPAPAPVVPAAPVTPTVPGPPATTPVVASTDGLVAPKTNSAFFGSKKNVVTSQPTTGGMKVVSMGGGAVDMSALPDDMLAAMGNQSLESMITNLNNSGEDIQGICSPF
jgi:hypothetical protein